MTQHALRGKQVYRLVAVLALLPTDAHLKTSTAEKLNSDNSHAVHLSVHTVSVITLTWALPIDTPASALKHSSQIPAGRFGYR